MFDFDIHRDPIWDEVLRPINEDEWNKEAFATWWARHRKRLAHLDPLIAEQWVHRHWTHSRFAWLPLENLAWYETVLSGEEVLASVQRIYARTLYPEHDYEIFTRPGRDDPHPTAKALSEGTWDYPIVVLQTPSGVHTDATDMPDVKMALIEGHQRHRYLNALHARGTPPAGPHRVFVLRSPIVTE